MFEHPKKVGDRWVGEEKIFLHDGKIDTLAYTFQFAGESIAASQRDLVLEVLKNYDEYWSKLEHKIAMSIPLSLLSNRLLIFAPAIVGSEKFDFMIGFEFVDGSMLYSAFFGYIDGQLKFEHVDRY